MKFDSYPERNKRRRRSHASSSYGCTLSYTASMEARVAAEPSMATLPKLDSFAFTSSSTEERLENSATATATATAAAAAAAEEEEEEEEEEEVDKEKGESGRLKIVQGAKLQVNTVEERLQGATESGEADGDREQPLDVLKLGEAIPGACDALVTVARELVADLEGLTFKAPVSCVYNPLVYAQNLHEQYIRRHGGRRVEILLVGMNPGPFGMAQTGVPFGDSRFVRTFHGLVGKVDSPKTSHPKRPVYGLACQRSEISGQRLWGWAQDRFGCATAFFNRFWVYNYCPLVFMEASGKNRTPDKLHPSERAKLEVACNRALSKTISILRPAFVIGVGKYAAEKIQACNIAGVKVGDIMHPSPANPQANKDWGKKVEAQLLDLGVVLKK